MKKINTFIFFDYINKVGQTIINRDPEIKKMVDEISKEKIEKNVGNW